MRNLLYLFVGIVGIIYSCGEEIPAVSEEVYFHNQERDILYSIDYREGKRQDFIDKKVIVQDHIFYTQNGLEGGFSFVDLMEVDSAVMEISEEDFYARFEEWADRDTTFLIRRSFQLEQSYHGPIAFELALEHGGEFAFHVGKYKLVNDLEMHLLQGQTIHIMMDVANRQFRCMLGDEDVSDRFTLLEEDKAANYVQFLAHNPVSIEGGIPSLRPLGMRINRLEIYKPT